MGKKCADDDEGTINHLVHYRPFLGFKAVFPTRSDFVIPPLPTKKHLAKSGVIFDCHSETLLLAWH